MVDKTNNAIVKTWAHKVKSLLDSPMCGTILVQFICKLRIHAKTGPFYSACNGQFQYAVCEMPILAYTMQFWIFEVDYLSRIQIQSYIWNVYIDLMN
jgi:hypothetical protein